MAANKRYYTHSVLHHGEYFSKHSSYKLAEQKIKRICSKFAWDQQDFRIIEL